MSILLQLRVSEAVYSNSTSRDVAVKSLFLCSMSSNVGLLSTLEFLPNSCYRRSWKSGSTQDGANCTESLPRMHAHFSPSFSHLKAKFTTSIFLRSWEIRYDGKQDPSCLNRSNTIRYSANEGVASDCAVLAVCASTRMDSEHHAMLKRPAIHGTS